MDNLYYKGIDYKGIRESLCQEFCITKQASQGPQYSSLMDQIKGRAKDSWKSLKNPDLSAKAIKGKLIGATALAGVATIGSVALKQREEMKRPLASQIADPNTALGGSARAAVGLGGALLAANAMNELARNRHTNNLV